MSVASPAGTAVAPAVPEQPEAARVRRFWSSRRNTAALVALVVVAAAGALLYEESYIRSGHRAHAWRTWISDQLANRHLDDAWAIAGAAVLCALGLWLLLLAATPGLRRLLPLATADTDGLRAGLSRRAAAAMLRRAALETPGVREADAEVGRRKARVRAVVGFGDPTEVKAALAEHLSAERGRLGLVRPPMVNVKVKGKS
ncbi:DUF6286 domain-containing protein [Streptacidiphilus carbonis]|uniref:DUF6286 domain-containing protein n=1 Tax=Streptacidiphilus carbonis TaxID=105422 RepID=UPI0005A864CE|nr:DUF6286 domain-containing protein [Streptacidiphilus carbonis]